MNKLEIICADCKKSTFVERVEYDPKNAVVLKGIVCPDCDSGGFDMPEYYDEKGNYIDQSEMIS